MLQRGDKAPDFETIDCRGQRIALRDLRGKRVVLFFFPRAFSVACTLEVRHFRDHYEQIVSHNAELIGVSLDRTERNCKFADEEQLQFRLIGDESRQLSEAYGVVWPILRIDRRATFIIDADGMIEDVFHHEVQVYRHLDDVLAKLKPGEAAVPAAGVPASST